MPQTEPQRSLQGIMRKMCGSTPVEACDRAIPGKNGIYPAAAPILHARCITRSACCARRPLLTLAAASLPRTTIMALSSVRTAVLRHIRIPVQQSLTSSSSHAALSLSLWRGFAGGGYLDKTDVTQRVLDVTKHFEKIDPVKASGGQRSAACLACGLALAICCCCLMPACRGALADGMHARL